MHIHYYLRIMDDVIELTLDCPHGIIDCRLEPQRNDEGLYYAATILYPEMVNGYSRSEIYCHDMHRDASGKYRFDEPGELHPKILRIEEQLSATIMKAHGE